MIFTEPEGGVRSTNIFRVFVSEFEALSVAVASISNEPSRRFVRVAANVPSPFITAAIPFTVTEAIPDKIVFEHKLIGIEEDYHIVFSEEEA